MSNGYDDRDMDVERRLTEISRDIKHVRNSVDEIQDNQEDIESKAQKNHRRINKAEQELENIKWAAGKISTAAAGGISGLVLFIKNLLL